MADKLWFIESEIGEDGIGASTLGPFLKKPTQKEAEIICQAYTGVAHDGSCDAYFDIESRPIYKNVEDFAKKKDFMEDFEAAKNGTYGD